MNRDELEGKATEAKGKIKKNVGEMTGNERLRDEGVADEIAGDTQDKIGEGRRKIGNAIENLGDKIKD
jgi:uncharacterized protein YjbJ (UPF0337 family)